MPGGWKLNGRKVWTTYAHRCHYAITLARSAPATEKRHEGLTQFILDLHAPGLTINPIINLPGKHEFNEMVLDECSLPMTTWSARPAAAGPR